MTYKRIISGQSYIYHSFREGKKVISVYQGKDNFITRLKLKIFGVRKPITGKVCNSQESLNRKEDSRPMPICLPHSPDIILTKNETFK